MEPPELERISSRSPIGHSSPGFSRKVEEALGDRRLLLAFDEFELLEDRVRQKYLDRPIFDILRHLIQHTEKLAFIFAGTHKLEELSRDYWSMLFNIALYSDIRFLEGDRCSSIDS